MTQTIQISSRALNDLALTMGRDIPATLVAGTLAAVCEHRPSTIAVRRIELLGRQAPHGCSNCCRSLPDLGDEFSALFR